MSPSCAVVLGLRQNLQLSSYELAIGESMVIRAFVGVTYSRLHDLRPRNCLGRSRDVARCLGSVSSDRQGLYSPFGPGMPA